MNTKLVTMLELRFGYFPQRFSANGKEFNVSVVERCWTERRKLIFQVKCGAEHFRLIHSLKPDRWVMEM